MSLLVLNGMGCVYGCGHMCAVAGVGRHCCGMCLYGCSCAWLWLHCYVGCVWTGELGVRGYEELGVGECAIKRLTFL